MILYDHMRGAPAPDLTLAWADPATGELLDLGVGVTFVLELGVLPLGGFQWVKKETGITGSNGDPNVTITWDPDDLAAVPDGTWLCRLTASGIGVAGETHQLVFMMRVASLELGAAMRPVGAWPAHMPCAFSSAAMPTTQTWAARNIALVVATQVLWALSGRRFGWATTTVRPGDRRSGLCGIPDEFWLTSRAAGPWPLSGGYDGFPWGRWWAYDPGEFNRGTVLRLPRRPVVAVHEVIVDGVVLPPSAYRVDRWGELVRLDGGTWPATQDMAAEDDEPGAFSITYTYGKNVPAAGLLGGGVFACEIAKLMMGQECQLPARVTAFQHGGANVAMLDPQDFLDKGQTGIYLADVFIRSYNPNRLQQRSRFMRADARGQGTRVART